MKRNLKAVVKKAVRQSQIDGFDHFRPHVDERTAIAESIARHAEGGKVALEVWQMDCDCASWTAYDVHPAHVMLIVQKVDDIYRYAEGPVRWRIISPSDIPSPDERPASRDHVLEAYEDGHPHSVSYCPPF